MSELVDIVEWSVLVGSIGAVVVFTVEAVWLALRHRRR
jgi:hypothetical protein